jgi:outer membrane protein assembly factor BamB
MKPEVRSSRSRLGWLGPVIVIGGAAVAAVGIAYWMHVRPQAGDTIAEWPGPDEGTVVVVRAERGGERAFVELHVRGPFNGDEVEWQALVPHYAGDANRPAIAWNHDAMTVRVERGGRAEVFALSMRDGSKLGGFRIAVEHEPIRVEPAGPITLTDHVRSYELVGGDGWHQLVAVDLATGKGLWKVDLGAAPVTDGGSEPASAPGAPSGRVWVTQGAHRKMFDGVTGRELTDRS